ncbi:hypothetical protein [Gordonia phage GTE5]|uniref:Uncharacterized protein n=1 Tax=Gordonia phage GTE5 TaxID=319522 RepID=G8EJT3_9CAUD|nr:hypothetical protein GoPhGTE5p66 [Gordonia phage GTE5]AET09815.1 hypothetical protein [Gordonia phage GTE5]
MPVTPSPYSVRVDVHRFAAVASCSDRCALTLSLRFAAMYFSTVINVPVDVNRCQPWRSGAVGPGARPSCLLCSWPTPYGMSALTRNPYMLQPCP